MSTGEVNKTRVPFSPDRPVRSTSLASPGKRLASPFSKREPSCRRRIVRNALVDKITPIVAIRVSRKARGYWVGRQRVPIIGNGGTVYCPWSVVRGWSAVVCPGRPRVQRGAKPDRTNAETSSARRTRRPSKCDERTQKLRSRLAPRVATKRTHLCATSSFQARCWHDVQTSKVFGETKPFGNSCLSRVAGRRS